ncbi:MAG TPA: MBL fold metallo-hydrolase [Trebonia sp.]|jgi:7,8-dihydropterin-6-yl-methyl-4-(beta-D-ribofuranosyl)aminobenzene 5'-phosphate synthase|nr:MBL fold metallo-hydrolase [Trebonia sp.]
MGAGGAAMGAGGAAMAARVRRSSIGGMCDEPEHAGAAEAAVPRAASGLAVDPISLPEVDEMTITTLADNVFDALLASAPGVTRPPMNLGTVPAWQFTGGATAAGLRAEHGFSALVSVRRESSDAALLFDTGVSPDGMTGNAKRLGIGFGHVQGVVLSHGHFDHAGGLDGLARERGRSGLPLTVHPAIWTRRRIALPGRDPFDMPTLSKGALEREGFQVIERREPSLLAAGSVLITGEVDRTTDFERGMPPAHQAWDGHCWEHDAKVIDDQALVVNVRGQGLVVLTGCGHAGVVNIVRHAMRLTGVTRLHAIVGGFHLNGPAFEPIIGPTVTALAELAPSLIVPGHCTGWRAQHALARALPDAWVQSSVGTSYRIVAA